MNVTSAPTRAAATDWFDPFPPGPSLKSEPIKVSPVEGWRSALNATSATNTPRIATPRLVSPIAKFVSGQVGRDDALLEDKTTVEAALPGLDDAIRLARKIVERK